MSIGRLVSLVIALVIFAYPSAAQVSVVRGQELLTQLEAQFRADFSVPDAPALLLADASPSDLLRPATVREFAVAASQFRAPEGGFQVPEAFALEVAPFLLANGRRLTLPEYRKRPALYRLRISGATGRDSLDRAVVAFGLRAALIDEADLRTRQDYLSSVTEITRRITDLVVEERLARAALGERPDPNNPLDLTDLTGDRLARLDALLGSVDSLRLATEERAWNARVLDVAIGARAGAVDTPGNDLAVTDYALWATYGSGFGRWGQLLVGVTGAFERDRMDEDFKAAGSVSTRLYAGSNRFKAFAEAQGAAREGSDFFDLFLNAGGEARIFNSLWATFATGVELIGGDDIGPRLVGRFALKVGLPDLLN